MSRDDGSSVLCFKLSLWLTALALEEYRSMVCSTLLNCYPLFSTTCVAGVHLNLCIPVESLCRMGSRALKEIQVYESCDHASHRVVTITRNWCEGQARMTCRRPTAVNCDIIIHRCQSLVMEVVTTSAIALGITCPQTSHG